MTAILNTLLEVTVYSAVIFGAIRIFRLLLKKHVSPAMLYIVWFLLIARLLMPITVPSGFSFFVIPAGQAETQPQNEILSALPESGNAAVSVPDMPQTDGLPLSYKNMSQTAQNAVTETSASPKPAQPEITWETALALLWLAGAAAMLAQIAVSSIKLKKRLKSAKPIPPKWNQIAEELKSSLGLRRGIRTVMIEGFPSPALSAGLKPVVIMPAELLSHSDETVRFALLHELTHIQRKDHIMSILLLFLRAVYWFNPVVWMTVKQMRLDMESACDSRLTRHMNGAYKKRYAGAILSMYARQQVRFVLGMALGQTKKTAEQRLRGLFMRGKASRKAKLTAMLFAAILLFTCFTTACQPTPDKPAIVNKNDGKLEEKLRESPRPPESYKALERWNETVQNDKLKIVIDTDVFVPDVTKYPAQKLKRAVFSQQRVDELVNYFAQGKQLHLSHVMTKADYAQWIVNVKRGDLIDGKYVVTQESLDLVKFLEELQAAAPEDSPMINTDTTLTYERDIDTGEEITKSGKNHLQVAFDNGNGSDASISIDNYTPGYNSFTSFSYNAGGYMAAITESMYQDMLDYDGTEEEYGYTGAGELFDKVEITREEAVETADEVLSGLGIKHVMLVNSEKYVMPRTPEKSGYALLYARESGGMPLYWFEGGSWFSGEQPAAYTPPFTEEVLRAYVSKDGLAYLDWRGCADVVETVNENVELLPFETIQQMLKDLIFYKKSFMQDDSYRDLTVTVTSAGLRTGYIGVKDNINQALMVPAWVFETRISYYEKASGTQLSYKDNTYMLSAIDGGVMEYPREPDEYIDAED